MSKYPYKVIQGHRFWY